MGKKLPLFAIDHPNFESKVPVAKFVCLSGTPASGCESHLYAIEVTLHSSFKAYLFKIGELSGH